MRLFVSVLAISRAVGAPSMAADNGAMSDAERAFLASMSGLSRPADRQAVRSTMERALRPESRQDGDCGRARKQALKGNAP
jgi:hypothetical protein